MTSPRLSRRGLLTGAVSAPAVAALLAACSDSNRSTHTTPVVPTPALPGTGGDEEAAFALPFTHLITDDMVPLGQAVERDAPLAFGHARDRLSGHVDEASLRRVFSESCREDVEVGEVVEVDGWTLPATLAGVAVALSRLA